MLGNTCLLNWGPQVPTYQTSECHGPDDYNLNILIYFMPCSPFPEAHLLNTTKECGKGKRHPITGYEGPTGGLEV
jgi:hypothetical protein